MSLTVMGRFDVFFVVRLNKLKSRAGDYLSRHDAHVTFLSRHTGFYSLNTHFMKDSTYRDVCTLRLITTVFSACSRWRHQMETFSALLALCAGNSPVTGEFPSQRPVTRSFDVFFDLRLNKRLSKQWRRWWFETPSYSLWRHCNVTALYWYVVVS